MDLMNFVALRRGVFRSLIALILALAPLSAMSLSDAAFAAPRGKAAKATSGKRSAGKHAGGHRHAWHRHGGGRHAKGSRSSRRHAAAAQVEGDDSPVRAVPVPIRQAAPAPVDNGRAVVIRRRQTIDDILALEF